MQKKRKGSCMADNMELEQEIISLAKKGLLAKDICKQLYVGGRKVQKTLEGLNDPTSPLYNPTDFNTAVFMKEMQNETIKTIDKDLLHHVIVLIEKGFTFFEIAIFLQIPEQEIRELLKSLKKETCPFYDLEQYWHIKALEQQNRQRDARKSFRRLEVFETLRPGGIEWQSLTKDLIIKQYEIYKRGKQLVQKVLTSDQNLTDEELGAQLGMRRKAVYDFFHDQMAIPYFSLLVDKETKQKILQKREERRKECVENYQFRASKHCNHTVYERLHSQKKFWINFLLTFQLSFHDFASIIKVEESEDTRKDIEYLASSLGERVYRATNYNFSIQLPSEAKQMSAKNYLKQVMAAKQAQKNEEYLRLLDLISDKEYLQIAKSKQSFSQLTEEEIRIVIKHRLKYALPASAIPYNSQKLIEAVPEDLKEEYEALRIYIVRTRGETKIPDQKRNRSRVKYWRS